MRETVEIMRYPVTLTPAPEGGYMVSFVDIPEALTQGETVAEAMEAAKAQETPHDDRVFIPEKHVSEEEE